MGGGFVRLCIIGWMLVVVVRGGGLGVCYGSDGSGFPSPEEVVHLLKRQTLVSKVRLLTSDEHMLQALAKAQAALQVMIGIPNEQVPGFAQSVDIVREWAETVLAAALAAGANVVALAVGSEVLNSDLGPLLVPAMKNLYSVLLQMGVADRVKVSSPVSMAVLSISFPPSSSTFDPSLLSDIRALLDFLSGSGSYFMANLYPYYAYRDQGRYVSLDYALLQPNPGVTDPNTGLHYWNMFDAQLDALYYAMAALQHEELGVIVTETGWPCMGDIDEVDVVNPENAAAYNGNLIKHLASGDGTPLRRGVTVDTYLYELFNEDLKPGPTSHQNWGLFKPDGTKLYDIGLEAAAGTRTSTSTSSSYCVANPGASFASLQDALDWACGPGEADCEAIQPGNPCYFPDSIQAHASYAFNNYYQANGLAAAACNFEGVGLLTSRDPSYDACFYKGGGTSISSLLGNEAPSSSQPSKLAVILFTSVLLLID